MSKTKMNALDIITTILVLIGGLNWGLVGAFNYNVVSTLTGSGETSIIATIIYILVGLSAIYGAIRLIYVALK